MLFFKYSVNGYGLGLSNELLFIIIAQGTAKLWPVKAKGLKKNLTQVFSDPFLQSKRLMHKAFFSDF